MTGTAPTFSWYRAIILSTAFLITLAVISMRVFWRDLDPYDDTGYMLAILRGVDAGKVLYSEVFSQYGPFFNQAWLSISRTLSLPLDHNHLGLIVTLLWMGTSILGACWIQRQTKNTVLTALTLLFGGWLLRDLNKELAHPVSLCALLAILSLVLLHRDVQNLRRLSLSWVIAGGVLAALTLTKINLGAFHLTAIGLALIWRLVPYKWLTRITTVTALVLPLMLVGSSWNPENRITLIASVIVSTVMLYLSWSRYTPPIDVSAWRNSLMSLLLGGVLATLSIAYFAWQGGVSLQSLIHHVAVRPAQLPGAFSLEAQGDPYQAVAIILSCLLAVLRLISWRWRKWRTTWLYSSIGVLLIGWGVCFVNTWAQLCFAQYLVWVPLALSFDISSTKASSGSSDQARSNDWPMLCMSLAGAWQLLGTYPVNGAQISIPSYLSTLAWLPISLSLFTGRKFPYLSLKYTRWAGVGLVALVVARDYYATAKELIPRYHTYQATKLPGLEWSALNPTQVRLYETLVDNLKSVPGPLFTLPGLRSLDVWSGKPYLTYFNGNHVNALFNQREVTAVLEALETHPSWTCIIAGDGKRTFGGGANYETYVAYIKSHTKPWFHIADYEVRLAKDVPVPRLRNALWKEPAGWQLSISLIDQRQPHTWRLISSRGASAGPMPSHAHALPHPNEEGDSPTLSTRYGEYLHAEIPESLRNALDSIPENDYPSLYLEVLDEQNRLISQTMYVALTAH